MVDGEYTFLKFNKIDHLIILSTRQGLYTTETLVQSVEQRIPVGLNLSDILRSLVRIQQVGIKLFFE